MDIVLEIVFAGMAITALFGISWNLHEIKDHLKMITEQLTIANKKK